MPGSRIYQVISGDLWAGAENQCYQLCAQLQKKGVRVHPVLFNDGELAHRLKSLGLPVLIWDESTVSTLRMIVRTRRLVSSNQPVIAHTHGQKEAIVFGLAKILTNNHIKIIRTIHGGQEYRIPTFDLRRQMISRVNKLVNAYIVDRIITVSPELQRSLVNSKHPAKVATIINGIDCVCLRNSNQSIANQKPPSSKLRLAMFARLVGVKRHDLAINALSLIGSAAIENFDSVELHIFGDGPLAESLKELCQSLHLCNHVVFHGFVSNPTDAMRTIDAMLMPSDHEGTPMALLEAMTLGVPVIGHSIGGIKDILSFTGQGVLVENHNAQGYADAIVKLCQIFPGLDENKEQTSEKFARKYNIDNMCTQYIAQYKQLLGHTSG